MNDIKLAVDELAERRSTYVNAENYYRGGEAEVFANAKWRQILRRNELDYVLNYTQTVVNSVLDRLEIANVAGVGESANSTLNEIWEQNELTLDATEIHRRALVFGECYAIVWPGEDGKVQITYNSPLTTIMLYDDENPRKKRVAVKMWQTLSAFDKPIVKMNLFYDDRVEKYWRQGELNLVTASETNWNHSETVDNPWGEIPVFHFRTHRPYGTPEHAAAIGPQDAINKIVVNHMETIDYHGAPQRFAISNGMASSELQDFDEEEAMRNNIGSLKSGPGQLWYLNGVSNVGQFNAADHKNFTEPIMVYVKAMASLTQTPIHFFIQTQVVSGEALRTAEAPLTKKIRERQISFGSTWRDLFRFALKIEGVESDVQVNWQGIESIDTTDNWNIALQKQSLGIPLLQILLDMGYDKEVAEEIDKAVKEEEKRKQELAAKGMPVANNGAGGMTNVNGMNAHNMALHAQSMQQHQQDQTATN
jgi:hypothetical protein